MTKKAQNFIAQDYAIMSNQRINWARLKWPSAIVTINRHSTLEAQL
jgi:hypothetical protein